jgi:hypothetical protein
VYRHFFREFLNRPGHHSEAFVAAHVDAPPKYEPDDVYIPYVSGGHVTIADCNRMVTLSFDADSPEGRENAVYKLDLLLRALNEFRVHLLDQFSLAAGLEALRERRGDGELTPELRDEIRTLLQGQPAPAVDPPRRRRRRRREIEQVVADLAAGGA